MNYINAKWITVPKIIRPEKITGDYTWTDHGFDITLLPDDCHGLALFSKKLSVNGLKKAIISATSLGVFELYINGKRVGINENGKTVYDEMKPGWTDYSKRALFYTYDITEYLSEGENTVLAAVAPGWYNGKISYQTYGDSNHVAFAAEITLDIGNGLLSVGTDSSWNAAFGSAFRTLDIWDGVLFDCSLPTPDEISADTSLENWYPSVEEDYPIAVTPTIGPAVRIRPHLALNSKISIIDRIDENGTDYGCAHIASVSDGNSFTISKGKRAIVDFGQNHVCMPSFRIKGEKGGTVVLRVGEMLNDSGLVSRGNDGPENTVYSLNYRTAVAKIVIKTDGREIDYRTVMTFFGCRYFEFTADCDAIVSEIGSNVTGSEIAEAGRIETSDSMVNKLFSNVLWGQRSNYLSIPTDCPQRNERLGWTGDTQTFCATAAYNADVLDFFRKWLQDMRDSQSESGDYPDVVPAIRIVARGSSGYTDASIIVTRVMWKMYGDITLVSEHYASMKKYMDWLDSRGTIGPVSVYGDWLSFEPTDRDYISAAYYILDNRYMIEMSEELGRVSDTKHFRERLDVALGAFKEKYCDSDGNLLPEHRSQTCYLLALKFGLIPEENRPRAIKELAAKIKDNRCVLSTGFIGTYILCDTLSEIGENNLAYSLLLQTECPSWFYSILQGATTVWERWNSYTKAKGFGNVGMNSFNHYAYGSVIEWIYAHVCGIQNAEGSNGFGKVLFCPKPDTRADDELPDGQKRIIWAKGEYNSVSGRIISEWSLEQNSENAFDYRFVSPVAATIELFAFGKNNLSLNGVERTLTDRELSNGIIRLEVPRGEYTVKVF